MKNTLYIKQKLGNLSNALKKRGIKIIEITDITVSIKIGSGVFLSRNTIRKRIKRKKDGFEYEKTVNPSKFGFIVESMKEGLIVLIKPSKELLESSF